MRKRRDSAMLAEQDLKLEDNLLMELDRASDSNNTSTRGDCTQSVSNFNFYDPAFQAHLLDRTHPNRPQIVNFLYHLALCHTVVIHKKPESTPKYDGFQTGGSEKSMPFDQTIDSYSA